MRKLPYSVKYRHIRIIFFAVISMVIAHTSIVQAQKRSSNFTTNKKETTRVFYGLASFYANKFNGRKTASGEKFDQKKMTAACNVLPLGTMIKVTNLRNDKWVIVKINDRIHPRMKRIVDLSSTAAQKLGYISRGVTRVKIEVLNKKRKSK